MEDNVLSMTANLSYGPPANDVSPYVCSFGFGCRVATFWEIAAHSVDICSLCILTICNISLNWGSDCFNS